MKIKYTKYNGDLYSKVPDTGWKKCELYEDVSDAGNAVWQQLHYRRIGDIVYLTGAVIIKNPSWGKTITKLPYQFVKEYDQVCRSLWGTSSNTPRSSSYSNFSRRICKFFRDNKWRWCREGRNVYKYKSSNKLISYSKRIKMSKSIQLKDNSGEKYYVHPYFPIGSIYMNITNIDPSSYFGGVWERLKDRFLLAVGDTYTTAGATGGEATHTLSVAEMPSHTHTFTGTAHTHSIGAHSHGLNSHVHSVGAHSHGLNNHKHSFSATTSSNGAHAHRERLNLGDKVNPRVDDYVNYGGYGQSSEYNWTGSEGSHTHTISGTTGAASGSTANSTVFNTGAASGNTANSTAFNSGSTTQGGTNSNTGSGKTHNNMPPYITVYMWKRVS